MTEKYKDSLFIAKNPKEWKESLEVLILDGDLRIKKGKDGREIAKDFSLEKTVNKYEEIFKDLNYEQEIY